MNTGRVFDQWCETNRAFIDPLVRWNTVAAQTAERLVGNRQWFDQWFEFNRTAASPLVRWNQIALESAEKLTRRNLQFAQDCLEVGVRQIDLIGEVRDPQRWADEEGKLVQEFGRKIVDHAGDYLKTAKETQDALAQWADSAAKEAAERAEQAARNAAGKSDGGGAKPGEAPRPPGAQPSARV